MNIEQAREFSKALRIRSAYGSEARQAVDTIDALIAELAALKNQEPVAHLYIDSYGTVKLGQTMPPEEGAFSVYLAAGAQPYSDSTAELSVGDSSFESWYASYVKEGTKGLKHHCRDAYAAGMGDQLVVAAGAQPVHPTVPQVRKMLAQPIPDAANFKTAAKYLNNNDKAFWITGWNECRDAMLAAAPVQAVVKDSLTTQEPDDLTIAYMSGYYDGKKAQECKVLMNADDAALWLPRNKQAQFDVLAAKEQP